MKNILFLSVTIGVFIFGCADTQQQQNSSSKFPTKNLPAEASNRQMCVNCMAKFKTTLGSHPISKTELYKMCPVCKPY